MILTPTQVRTAQKAIGVANDVLPQLEWLERVAQEYPPIQERVAVVRASRDMLIRLCESMLEADRILGQ